MVRILAFAGSLRKASFNKRLVRIAARRARERGAEVTEIDLRDFPMPIYDGDLEDEHGAPKAAVELKQILREHDGLLLSCPEYNSSITPVLKNTIDWCSRAGDGEPALASFTGKTAALLAASPGALGGLRGLVHVRAILGNIGVFVTPTQLAVPKVGEVLTEHGTLADERIDKGLDRVVAELVDATRKLRQA